VRIGYLYVGLIPLSPHSSSSSFFGPNTFLYILFSHNISLCFSLSTRDKVSNPKPTTFNIVFPYISSFLFVNNKQQEEILLRVGSRAERWQLYGELAAVLRGGSRTERWQPY
jgi:hypothetical protein